MLNVKIIDSFERLAGVASEWNQLARDSSEKSPMLSYAWAASYLEHLRKPRESWCCLLAYEETRLVGVLPLLIIPHHVLGVYRPLLKTPFLTRFLVAEGKESEVIPFILSSLDRAHPKWFSLEINQVPETSPAMPTLDRKADGVWLIRDFEGCVYFTHIEGTYERFYNNHKKNHKKNLRGALNHLRELGQVSGRFLAGRDATEHQLDTYMQIEASGYKSREGDYAIALSPQRLALKKTLTRRLSELAWLEWHMLQVGGRTIACILAVKMARTLYLFKLSIDETYTRYSPGRVLVEKVYERAFSSDNTDEINWMTDYPWIESWPVQKRNQYMLYISPRRTIPFIYDYLPKKTRMLLRDSRLTGPMVRWLHGKFKGKHR